MGRLLAKIIPISVILGGAAVAQGANPPDVHASTLYKGLDARLSLSSI